MVKTTLFPLVVSPEERIRFKLNDTTTVCFFLSGAVLGKKG